MSDTLHILLIDDDEVDRQAVRRALRSAGLDLSVTEARDATEGLTLLASRLFDCVLLDFQLPKSDGLSLLRELKKKGIGTPVVMLTGQGDEETAVEIMKSGAADYIAKSTLSAERLSQSVRHAVRLHRAEQQAEAQTQALRRSEEFKNRIIASSPDCIKVLDADGSLVWMSESGQRLFEVTDFSTIRGETWASFFKDEHGDAARAAFAGASGGRVEKFEGMCATQKGTPKWWEVVIGPLSDASGAPPQLIVISRDITERRTAEAERQRLHEQTQNAIRSREDLLSTVSHDLRSPLSTIMLAAAILKHYTPSDDTTRVVKQASAIERAAKQMEHLIRDLLDIASIESGHLSIDAKPQEVLQLVADAVDATQPLAQVKSQQIRKDGQVENVFVLCDRQRFEQVFTNLLVNAIKFTPASGTIAIQTALDEGQVRFSISDTGPGIEPAQLPHVFDRFWQAKDTPKAGSGLGLAICRGIIEQHNGRIWVESTPGVGTRFSFTLPIARIPSVR